jgi:hypothetical protein
MVFHRLPVSIVPGNYVFTEARSKGELAVSSMVTRLVRDLKPKLAFSRVSRRGCSLRR